MASGPGVDGLPFLGLGKLDISDLNLAHLNGPIWAQNQIFEGFWNPKNTESSNFLKI